MSVIAKGTQRNVNPPYIVLLTRPYCVAFIILFVQEHQHAPAKIATSVLY